MPTDSLFRYQYGESPIHHLDPRVKVVVTVLFVVCNSLLPDGAWVGFALNLCFLLFVLSLSQVAFARVLKYSALVVPFALVAVTVLFVTPGEPWLSLPVGNRTVVASVPGLVRFASILLRSWFSVQMAILLAMTTSLPDVLHALRHLGLPDVLAAITSFMVRYLSVLVEEAGRLLRARDARRAGTRSGAAYTWWQARVTGHMAGQLFLRSVERSERVYNAMLARGFHGHFLTIHPHRMFTLDWVGAGCGVLYLALVQILVRIG